MVGEKEHRAVQLACSTAEGSAGPGLREGISGLGWQVAKPALSRSRAPGGREDATRSSGSERPGGRGSV